MNDTNDTNEHLRRPGAAFLAEFEQKIGVPRAKWSKAQWRAACEALAGTLDSALQLARVSEEVDEERRGTRRGRPSNAGAIDSADQNYRVLAWQVSQRRESAAAAGRPVPTIKAAMRDVMMETLRRHNDSAPPEKQVSERRVESRVATAYTAVRKILKSTKSGD